MNAAVAVTPWRWRRRGPLTLLEARIGPVLLAFTSRAGGVSLPPYDSLNLGLGVGDAPERVAENRRRLLEALGLVGERVATAEQVHGRAVAVVRASDPPAAAAPRVDALVAPDGDVALMLRFADCVPVFLVAPRAGAFALVHAGWRGLAAGVIEAGASALVRAAELETSDLWAAIGPSIGPSYRVDEAVMAPLRERHPWADRYRGADGVLDLAGACRHALADLGIADERVLATSERTESPAFFSHRASGGRTGRMAAVVRAGADADEGAR
jgi:YfiH family protein